MVTICRLVTDYKLIFSPSSPQYVHKHRKITPLITRCHSNSSLRTAMLQGHGCCCDIRRLQWNSTDCLWPKVLGTLSNKNQKQKTNKKTNNIQYIKHVVGRSEDDNISETRVSGVKGDVAHITDEPQNFVINELKVALSSSVPSCLSTTERAHQS